ncbi:hypothetical protein PHMEG_0009574 [Phytophthora megakarya]|uniref:Uncharacterized protein n=1 Tax=Phytophthora megakarya TaxID=4795 RepID=A0A225WG70_9STRA|nr:hypothetical protein PHMEG_0009574 [Phytophthora megakarya]
MASSLQVADLFDAQAAEAPILRLVSVLNAQAAQIHELQENLRLVQATQRQTLADCETLHALVSPLTPRVQSTEDDVVTLKQFQVEALRQLETIKRQLQDKADRQDVDDVEFRAKTSSEQLGNELRSELASLQLVQCMQTEQSELHERLETIDRRLGAKMDKSEAARLDGVLVQIHGFRPMVSQLSAEVKNTNELRLLIDDIEDRHHQVVRPQIQRLDDTTEQLQRTLDDVKTATTTSDAALRTLSAKLHSNAGALTTQLQQHYRHFEASLLETEVQLQDLSRQLATKVPDTTHNALSSNVNDLRACCEKLQEHVELSTRFLDWFARRGEAYEHNLEIVETQLGRLAARSNPHNREPFGGRVRFPRSP